MFLDLFLAVKLVVTEACRFESVIVLRFLKLQSVLCLEVLFFFLNHRRKLYDSAM